MYYIKVSVFVVEVSFVSLTGASGDGSLGFSRDLPSSMLAQEDYTTAVRYNLL